MLSGCLSLTNGCWFKMWGGARFDNHKGAWETEIFKAQYLTECFWHIWLLSVLNSGCSAPFCLLDVRHSPTAVTLSGWNVATGPTYLLIRRRDIVGIHSQLYMNCCRPTVILCAADKLAWRHKYAAHYVGDYWYHCQKSLLLSTEK